MANLTNKDFWTNMAIVVGLLAFGFAGGYFFRNWQIKPVPSIMVIDYKTQIDSANVEVIKAKAKVDPEFRERKKAQVEEQVIQINKTTVDEIERLRKLDEVGRVAYLRSWINDSIRAGRVSKTLK